MKMLQASRLGRRMAAHPLRARPFFVGILVLSGLAAGCGERSVVVPPSSTATAPAGPAGAPRVAADCAVAWPLLAAADSSAADSSAAVDDRSSPSAQEPGAAWSAVAMDDRVACFDLSADETTAVGVEPSTSFTLTSRDVLGPEAVATLLEVSPPAVLEVTEARSAKAPGNARRTDQTRTFTVRPRRPFEEGTETTFLLRETPGGRIVQRWAFTVAAPLRVVHTLPDEASTDVPLDTGIELTFSHDDVTGVKEAFSIEPNVDGSFERHGRTWVFAPTALAPRTLYTVRLEGPVAVGDMRLGPPFTLQFETGTTGRQETAADIEFGGPLAEALPGEPPALSVFPTGGEPPQGEAAHVAVTVWAYSGVDAFVRALDDFASLPDWAWATRGSYTAPTQGLDEAARADVELQPVGDFGELVLQMPDGLAAGFYLIEATGAAGDAQAWLQVSDLSAYAAASVDGILVWANDAATGQPVAGADVRWVGGGVLGSTGKDGVAVVDTPSEAVAAEPLRYGVRNRRAQGTLAVTDGDRTLIVPLRSSLHSQRQPGFREFGATRSADAYWRYIYTDRHLYHLSDTVHTWGVARQRAAPAPGTPITLEIEGGGFATYDGREAVVARKTVQTSAAGTFLGDLTFDGASPGFYNLRAVVDGETIASTYLEIQDFVKPAYKMDVSAEPAVAFAGDTVTYTVGAQFFEGSPVPGLGLKYNVGTREGTSRTDADGQAAIAVGDIGTAEGVEQSEYSWIDLNVQPQRSEEGEILGSGSVLVYPAAVGLEANLSLEDGQVVASGHAYSVDLEAVRAADGDPAAAVGAPATGQAIGMEVTKITYARNQVGERYDYVQKKVVPRYEYREVRTPGPALSATTGADGAFALQVPAEKDVSYEVALTVTDPAGRNRILRTWIYTGNTGPVSFGPVLRALEDGPYDVGDTVTVTMDNVAEAANARYLFLAARNGVREYAIEDRPEHVLSFDEADVPDIVLAGVQFTGRTYREASYGLTLDFREEARQLSVELRAGAASYAPGAEATVGVRVTGPDGEGKEATVLLSGVDEAALTARGMDGGDLGILQSLYAVVPSGILSTYASHQVPLGEAGAEGGGGGEGRDAFKDVVLFREVRTAADGTAQVTFTLPDNLTSWRVAGLAVTDDLFAGAGLGDVVVQLPFFVDVTMNDTYLAADRPDIRVTAYGSGLKPGDPVTFHVEAPTLLAESVDVDGAAFTPVAVAIGPLQEGEHTLRVSGESGGQSDAVVRSLRVIPSRFVAVRAETTQLVPGERWSPPADAPAGSLTVVDAGRGGQVPLLEQLAWGHGDRLDESLARAASVDLLATYFEGTQSAPTGFHPDTYLTAEGGLALLPYGGADLELTARAAAAAADRVGKQRLVGYFVAHADDPSATREEVAVALAGLAAVGVPVLDRIRNLSGADDLAPREALYVALGAAQLGDEATAARLLTGLLRDFGQQRGAAVRLEIGDDAAGMAEATALAAEVAGLIGSPAGRRLLAYTTENPPRETTIALEQVGYLRAALPRLPVEPVRVAYEIGGERVERTLENGEALTLNLAGGPAGLQVLDGTAAATFSRLTAADVANLAADAAVTLRRSYGSPEGGSGVSADPELITVDPLAVVQVTLDYSLEEKAAEGCYQISDQLPSGLKPVTLPQAALPYVDPEQPVLLPYAVDGQRVSFCVSKDSKKAVRYLARVLGTGTYVAEPALMQSQTAPESLAVTGSTEVRIQ